MRHTLFFAMKVFLAVIILLDLSVLSLAHLLAGADPIISLPVTAYNPITSSPGATPFPITRISQVVTSLRPSYAVCNPNNTNCTTIYETRTLPYCNTIVPCYGGTPCTITDCAQTLTFSHDNGYVVAPAATGCGAVLPMITKYAMIYEDYAAGSFENVIVEKCGGNLEMGGCVTHTENWSMHVQTTVQETKVRVTYSTVLPSPTVLSHGEHTMAVTALTTLAFVTSEASRSTITTTT